MTEYGGIRGWLRVLEESLLIQPSREVVTRLAHNQKIAGAIPALATIVIGYEIK